MCDDTLWTLSCGVPSEWRSVDGCTGQGPGTLVSHTATLVGDSRIVFIGGCTDISGSHRAISHRVHVFDVETRAWVSW